MLILTRSVGESITIGEGVKVTIVSTRGSQARISIQAPPDVLVHREEIYYKIRRERIQPEH